VSGPQRLRLEFLSRTPIQALIEAVPDEHVWKFHVQTAVVSNEQAGSLKSSDSIITITRYVEAQMWRKDVRPGEQEKFGSHAFFVFAGCLASATSGEAVHSHVALLKAHDPGPEASRYTRIFHQFALSVSDLLVALPGRSHLKSTDSQLDFATV
jgi:hypothetical protein